MSEKSLEKRVPAPLRDKGQYAIAFSVIAVMLWAVGFPSFILFFIGVLTFFIWKVFSIEGRHETRRIFEFYLSANEILRDDDRRWYGFEIQETIARGEAIVRSMSATPPLVHYGLGALYQKVNDHTLAVKHLMHVVEENSSNELAFVYPTKELREYVKMLRKIERAPAEAPLTSSAIRSLERSRKNRGKDLLESSRLQLSKAALQPAPSEQKQDSAVDFEPIREAKDGPVTADIQYWENNQNDVPLLSKTWETRRSVTKQIPEKQHVDRKTISEVLHDIYDKNVQ